MQSAIAENGKFAAERCKGCPVQQTGMDRIVAEGTTYSADCPELEKRLIYSWFSPWFASAVALRRLTSDRKQVGRAVTGYHVDPQPSQ
jgi:hypothetical protein